MLFNRLIFAVGRCVGLHCCCFFLIIVVLLCVGWSFLLDCYYIMAVLLLVVGLFVVNVWHLLAIVVGRKDTEIYG